MPAKKGPPLSDDERARRIRDLAEQACTSDDAAAFDRAFDALVTPEENGVQKVAGLNPESAKKAYSLRW